MLTAVTRTSSSCTGAFTAEMSLAVVEKTINDDGWLQRPLSFKPVSVFDCSLSAANTCLALCYTAQLVVSQTFRKSASFSICLKRTFKLHDN